MPSKFKSPFASPFKSAINRGTSWNTAVSNIAKRSGKTPEFIWNSLYKADLCYRQKFNGQWIYFPIDAAKCPAGTQKVSQFQMWQWFCEWSISSGFVTPEQFTKHLGSQQDFMTWSKKFWGRQFTSTKKGTKSRSVTRGRTYAFPTSKTTSARKAA